MSDKKETKKTELVEVIIDNRMYKLSCTESEDYVYSIASYINKKIKEIGNTTSNVIKNSYSFFILVAINIADELFKERAKNKLFDEQVNQFETLKRENERLSTQLIKTKEEKEVIDNKFNSLKKEKNNIEVEFNNLKKEKNNIEIEFNNLKKEKENIETEFNNTKNELVATVDSFSIPEDVYKHELELKDEQLKKYKNELNVAKSQLGIAKQRLENINSSNNSNVIKINPDSKGKKTSDDIKAKTKN